MAPRKKAQKPSASSTHKKPSPKPPRNTNPQAESSNSSVSRNGTRTSRSTSIMSNPMGDVSDISSCSSVEQRNEEPQPEPSNPTGTATFFGAMKSTATLSEIMGDTTDSSSSSNVVQASNQGRATDEESVSSEEEPSSNPATKTTTPGPKSAPKQQRRKRKQPNKLKVLKEMLHLQGTTHLLIPKLSFGRVIREILYEYSPNGIRVTPEMLMCLQEAAEMYTVQLLQDSYRCTFHRDRITLQPKDIQLALSLRREL